MRKLKLQVQTSIDGFMGGINGEMDWVLMNWSDDLITFVNELTKPVDTVLLGKNLAQGFIPHWTNAYNNPDTKDEAAIKFVETPKVVFSTTLTSSPWEQTTIASGNLADEVQQLKNQTGGDLIAYGGSQFVSSLIKENLIDELYLFINPTAIGKGLPIFHQTTGKQSYKLVKAQSFDCGIVVLTYNPVLHA